MKKILSAITITVSVILIGCGSPNLPEKNEIVKWENITLDKLKTELGFIKVEDELYARALSDKDASYISTYCLSKGGNFETLHLDFIESIVNPKQFINKHIDNSSMNKSPSIKACIKNNNYLFILIEQGYNQFNKATRQSFNDKMYFISSDENNQKKYISFINKVKNENEKRMKEIEENIKKKKEEHDKKALEELKRIDMLRIRKGQHVVRFFNSYTFNENRVKESDCANQCTSKNIEDSGYTSMDKALENGWEFISKLDSVSYKVSENCTCTGTNVLIKK
jgi:hypothetical protein